jgi:hypothetical protein
MWTWISVGVVVLVVLVIVLVDTVGSSPAAKQNDNFGLASPIVVQEATTIPASVLNTVGVTSSVAQVGGFDPLAGQPKLTFASGSKQLPGFIYEGGEYCPYCAATRWAIVAALSRFGTFKNLSYMKSSATDLYPNTNTFTFVGSTYTSKYLVFKSYEVVDRNRLNIAGQQPTGSILTTINHYSSGGIPFLDMGNATFLVSAPYNPQVLQGESWTQIAAALDNPSNYGTQAIIATANYITAGICDMTKDAPASVCDSSGVKTAIHAIKTTTG